MKKEVRAGILLVSIFLAVFLFVSVKKMLFYRDSFRGIIDSVHYREKALPTVLINGDTRGFPFGGNGAMKVGDSLVKEHKSLKLRHYRQGVLVAEYEWGYMTGIEWLMENEAWESLQNQNRIIYETKIFNLFFSCYKCRLLFSIF